jgi:hypothetical protein
MLSDNEFKSKYSKISIEKKLQFLKQLLDRDNDLKEQFIAFSEDETEKLDNIVGEEIDEIKNDIHIQLSNLDLDNLEYDSYDYSRGDSYREHWEIENDAAIDEVKNEIAPYVSLTLSYVKKGNLLDAFRIVLGLYEGTQNLPDLDNDNCVFDGEYNNEVQAIVKEYFLETSNSVNNIVKSDNSIIEVLTLIFDRISLCDNQNAVNEESIHYDVKQFELLFQSLAVTEKTAIFLHDKIQGSKLESIDSAFILLNIATVTNNENIWINTAETYAEDDAKIAKQLLEKYHSKNQISDFNRIATEAFKNWPNEFDKYLLDHLDKEAQKELHVKALTNYVTNKRSISHFIILKSYLTKKEIQEFVNQFENSYPEVFYVQLLEIEKRYKEILTCVKENVNAYDLEKLIAPILNVYPNECFNIIVTVNNKAMNEYKRDRRTYQNMVKTLKLLKQITSKKNEAGIYLQSLYTHKPSLPALKDEMRMAYLITV